MAKHRHCKKKSAKPNSTNCIHQNNKKHKDDKPFTTERYEESREFDAFDHMMRDNRGVMID